MFNWFLKKKGIVLDTDLKIVKLPSITNCIIVKLDNMEITLGGTSNSEVLSLFEDVQKIKGFPNEI